MEALIKRSLLVLEDISQIWEQDFSIMMPYLHDFDRIISGGDSEQLPAMVSKCCRGTKSAMDRAFNLDGNAKLKVIFLLKKRWS